MCIQICVATNPPFPDDPPCPPGSVLGTGGTNASGDFVSNGMQCIPLSRPLESGECIYAFDVCLQLVGPVSCVTAAAPAPALMPSMLAVAVAMLMLIGGFGIYRRWRREGTSSS
jgi:hypothetical protein